MKKLIIFLAFIFGLTNSFAQTREIAQLVFVDNNQLGFEFSCVSTDKANTESPTGKLGVVYTTPYTYLSVGFNAPHERHPVFDDVQNRIHAGLYTKIGFGVPVLFDKKLSIYPYWTYSTKYYNIAQNSLIHESENYWGIAIKFSDIVYGAGVSVILDRHNVGLAMLFNLY